MNRLQIYSWCSRWILTNWSELFEYLLRSTYHLLRKNSSGVLCTWWSHQMETFSELLALCAGNSPVTGEFPSQRPVTRNFDVFFDLRQNIRLSKQSRGWCFETPSRPLWRHCSDLLLREPVLPATYARVHSRSQYFKHRLTISVKLVLVHPAAPTRTHDNNKTRSR